MTGTARGARLSVAIAAHPDRAAMAWDLHNRIGDRHTPPGGVRIVWDRDREEWATHAHAWRAHHHSATHHLVLQDDAVPCADLLAGTEHALVAVPPGDLVSLYLGDNTAYRGPSARHHAVTRAVAEADSTGASWICTPGTWWGIGLIAPIESIPAMLRYCAGRSEVYDRRLTVWCAATGRTVWHPWPSFVDHADTPSLVTPGRAAGRIARRFLGADRSALGFDPSGPIVHCPA